MDSAVILQRRSLFENVMTALAGSLQVLHEHLLP